MTPNIYAAVVGSDGTIGGPNGTPISPALTVFGLAACSAVATSNVASLSGLQTIDGYTLLANDRILLTGQTVASQNGVWQAAAGAWTRPTDFQTNATFTGSRSVQIFTGVTGYGSTWLLKTSPTIVDSTAQSWQFQVGSTIRVNQVEIDICRPWGIWNGVKPGDDVTVQLQAAITQLASNTFGGTVFFSVPGTYNVNGPQISGTTVNGAGQALSAVPSTLNVVSTTGFAPSGTLTVAGITGVVTYTGISGNSFTGCTASPGTPANGATVSASYGTYSGQILFPAIPLGGASTIPIRIRGCGPANTLGGDSAPVNNVILQSNLTTGWVFSVIPAFVGGSNGFSNICSMFKDINVQTTGLTDPQCGGIDLWSSNKAMLERVNVISQLNPRTTTATGSLAGIRMPGLSNSGLSTVRDSVVSGFPVGLMPGEHGNYEGYFTIAFAQYAIKGNAGGIANYFANVNVRGCNQLFYAPLAVNTSVIEGYFHWEQFGALADQSGALLLNDPLNGFSGRIVLDADVFTVPGTFPQIGGLNLDVVPRNKNNGLTLNQPTVVNGLSQGSKGNHPYDTFLRTSLETNSAAIPGACHPTQNAWITNLGTFSRTQPLATTVVGAGQTLSATPATLIVASTTGAPSVGIINVVGVGQVFYTSITGGGTPSYNGCVTLGGNSATPANGAAVTPAAGTLQQSGGATARAFVTALRGGISRSITAILYTGAAPNFTLNAHWINGGVNNAQVCSVQLSGTSLIYHIPNITNRTITSAVVANTFYVLTLSLDYGPGFPSIASGALSDPGLPARSRVYLNGAKLADNALPAASQALLIPINTGVTFPSVWDGFTFAAADTQTALMGFQVGNPIEDLDASPTGTIPPAYSVAANVTLTIDASLGAWQTVNITADTPFTLGTPSNPPPSTQTAEVTVEFKNATGGALTATSVCTYAGTFVAGGVTLPVTAGHLPANGKFGNVTFRWNGTKWVAMRSTITDY